MAAVSAQRALASRALPPEQPRRAPSAPSFPAGGVARRRRLRREHAGPARPAGRGMPAQCRSSTCPRRRRPARAHARAGRLIVARALARAARRACTSSASTCCPGRRCARRFGATSSSSTTATSSTTSTWASRSGCPTRVRPLLARSCGGSSRGSGARRRGHGGRACDRGEVPLRRAREQCSCATSCRARSPATPRRPLRVRRARRRQHQAAPDGAAGRDGGASARSSRAAGRAGSWPAELPARRRGAGFETSSRARDVAERRHAAHAISPSTRCASSRPVGGRVRAVSRRPALPGRAADAALRLHGLGSAVRDQRVRRRSRRWSDGARAGHHGASPGTWRLRGRPRANSRRPGSRRRARPERAGSSSGRRLNWEVESQRAGRALRRSARDARGMSTDSTVLASVARSRRKACSRSAFAGRRSRRRRC